MSEHKNIDENSVRDAVAEYVWQFKVQTSQDPEFKNVVFGSEFANPELFWKLIEQQATINYAELGDPAITSEQFIEIHKAMFLSSVVETMEDLKLRGLVEGDEHKGYVLTDAGKLVMQQKFSEK